MIAIVDCGRGNLFSISQALRHLGADHAIAADAASIEAAERIVLPGVGAFGDAMRALEDQGLVGPLRRAAAAGTPILGICLGMQLLCGGSEEFSWTEGLGLISGVVRRLPDGDEVRVPNVGWRVLESAPGNAVMGDLPGETAAYFVHSYAAYPENDSDIAATIAINGRHVVAAVQRGNVMGYQFHPEKSGAAGLEMIGRFLNRIPVRERRAADAS